MATSTIKIMDIKEGVFTKSQSGSSPNLTIRQYGKVVTVSGFVNGLSITANSETKVGTLTGVDYPQTTVRGVGSVGSNAYTMGTASYVAIGSTGSLAVTSSNGGSNKSLFFSTAYIVD